jgi:Xaa-Pro aminopeptidase
MKYLQINSNLFINNRKLFAKKIKSNAMAIFNSNDVMPTNADGTMPFKQNSDLFWLTGIDQEDSVLIIFPNSKDVRHKEVLFLKETNELIAIWEGQKLTKQTAFKTSGIKTVYWLSDFDKVLSNMIEKADSIYLNKNTHSRLTSEVETRDDRFRKKIIKKYPKQKINEVAPILHYLRSIKSENEIKLMQIACDITGKAFNRVLSFIKPGVTEYEIEADSNTKFCWLWFWAASKFCNTMFLFFLTDPKF